MWRIFLMGVKMSEEVRQHIADKFKLNPDDLVILDCIDLAGKVIWAKLLHVPSRRIFKYP